MSMMVVLIFGTFMNSIAIWILAVKLRESLVTSNLPKIEPRVPCPETESPKTMSFPDADIGDSRYY